MDTQIIIQVTAYISHSIHGYRLLEGYDHLAAMLQQVVLTAPPSLCPTVQAALAPLTQAHQQLRQTPPGWTALEESLYTQLGAEKVLGEAALGQLAQIAHQQRTDPEAAGATLATLRAATAALYTQAGRLLEDLRPLQAAAETTPVSLLPTPATWSWDHTRPAQLARRPIWPQTLPSLAQLRAVVRQRPAVTTLAAATPLVVSLASVAARLWGLYRQSKTLGAPTAIRPATDASQTPTRLHITHYAITQITIWPSKDS